MRAVAAGRLERRSATAVVDWRSGGLFVVQREISGRGREAAVIGAEDVTNGQPWRVDEDERWALRKRDEVCIFFHLPDCFFRAVSTQQDEA